MLSALLIMKAKQFFCICREFFAASLKENFIYLDLQMLWLSSLEMGTEISKHES